MSIVKLTILKDYPKTLAVPNYHHLRIFPSQQQYFVEFLPNNDSPSIFCPKGTGVCLDETYIPKKKDCWVRFTNENDEPLELAIEFFIP